MKKGWSIALLVVGILLLGALVANLVNGGIWIIEGLNGKDGLNGSDGQNGLDGQNGQNGQNGVDGKSAYELAVEDGFEGSLHEWLLSLAVRGQDGANGTPGEAGATGVGVQDVRINADGHLIVTLTNGTVLDAGAIDGAFSDEADEMGFYEVYELVEMNGGPNNYSTLTLRDYPASGAVVTYIDKGETVLRIGEQRNGADSYSRFLVNDRVCYAKSSCFELRYDYQAVIPSYNLPDQMVLIKDCEAWFDLGQIMPNIPSDIRVTFAYSGKGDTFYQAGKGWSLNPTEVGEETISVTISKNENGVWSTVAVEEIPTVVVDAQSDMKLTGLMLGDSRIAGGDLLYAITTAMPNLELIGTRTSGAGIRHEGRGAWSTKHYMTMPESDVNGVMTENPFYNPTTGTFDFTYYMEAYARENAFDASTLDFVVIHLGANDGWSEESAQNVATMARSIRSYSADIKVFVMTEYLSPADGFYQSGSRDVESMRQRQFAHYRYLYDLLGQSEREGIYLLPSYISINTLSDWPTGTVIVDGKETVVITDPQLVHLGMRGYRKEADTIRAWLYWLYGAQN